MRKLQTIPNPRLRELCAPINKFDKVLHTLYLDMLSVMHDKKGVGIAAPQVGVNRQFCIVNDIPMCNPQIIKASEDTSEAYEGCLSIPGQTFLITRPKALTIEYLDLAGKPRTIELVDFMARIACHELDHLQGCLIDSK